jgi:hypothetical protein
MSCSDGIKHVCFDNLEKPSLEKPTIVEDDVSVNWFDFDVNKLSYITTYRKKLFDWLWEVSDCCNMIPQGIIITFALFDLYISKIDIKKNKVQLVGVSCLSIVDKVLNMNPNSYDSWSLFTDRSYSCDEVSNMEQTILKEFNFDIIGIFDCILSHRFSEFKWVIVCCMLSFNNPISIDHIMNMNVDYIISTIKSSSEKSILEKKCLKSLKSSDLKVYTLYHKTKLKTSYIILIVFFFHF